MERIERTVTAIIIMLILFFTFFNSCSSEEEYDFVVDKNGLGDFTTIGEAIESAYDGSTIYVK